MIAPPLATGNASRLEERLHAALARARALGRPVLASVAEPVAPRDPLRLYAAARALGEDHLFYSERPDTFKAVVGVGVERAMYVAGAGDASSAAARWRELLSDAVVDAPGRGAGPVLLGGFAFDPDRPPSDRWAGFPAGLLSLPRYALTSHDGESWLTTNAMVHPRHAPHLLAAALEAGRDRLIGALDMGLGGGRQGAAPLAIQDVTTHEEWKRAVTALTREIRSGDVEKVVLARAVRVLLGNGRGGFSPEEALARLRTAYPACTVFAVDHRAQTFLGATPERLVSLEGGEVRASCLAGSSPRGADPAEDARLGSELLASAKDRAEHAVVVRMLTETLREACGEARVPPGTPELLRVHNVQHLYTPVAAPARAGQTVLDLVARLHPTPAVGGSPRAEALRLIQKHERLDRGWYAGPVGWMDARGEGEFVVAIRSALLHDGEATLYAGCGIVGDSDPEGEYRESSLKLQPVLAALGGAGE